MSTTVHAELRDWSPENPSTPESEMAEGGPLGLEDISVNASKAKTLAAFWQGITSLANDVAQLPLIVYRRLDPKGKERAKDHPAYNILHARPNEHYGPFRFKELLMHNCLLSGNGYAFIERTAKKIGAIKALWPLESDRITPYKVNGRLFYDYADENNRNHAIDGEDIFHLRGPGGDALQGEPVLKLAKDSLGVGLQAQRFGTRFFKNDAKPGLVIEYPDAVDAAAAKNILRAWETRHGGAANASKPAFLDRGGSVKSFSMSNEDAQFLETREFARTEVASWLNLPPHKVGDLTRATFSNIEQQNISYVVNSLMPWLVRWQDECNLKLLGLSGEYYAEFLVAALLRGDYTSRIAGHTQALQWGIMSIDEVRDLENLNPLPNGDGEKHYVPLNMTVVGAPPVVVVPPKPVKDEEKDKETKSERNISASFLQCELDRAYARMAHIVSGAATTPGKLQAFMDGDWQRTIESIEALLVPVSRVIGWRDATDLAEIIADDFRQMVLDQQEVDDNTLKARVKGRSKEISAARPAEIVSEFLRS